MTPFASYDPATLRP